MLQPAPFIMVPGTETWGEKYGVIGIVAAMSLLGIILGLRTIFAERRDDRQLLNTANAKLVDLQTAANAKLVESVQQSHREALELVADLQSKHDERYGALLKQHMEETSRYAEALREQSAATTNALAGITKKISSRGVD
jgi:hypothetical protein